MIINGVKQVGWEVYAGALPKQGSVAMPVSLTLVANVTQTIDLEIEEETGSLDFIQGLFIDNSAGASAVTIQNTITQQKLVTPAFSQATFPVYAPSKSKFSVVSAGAITPVLQFLNFPTPPAVWSAASASGVTPYNNLQTPVEAGGTGAASAFTATMPAVVGKTNYLTSYQISGGGATGASIIVATITGLPNTLSIDIAVPAGATLGIQPINGSFFPPLAASGPNTAIVLNVPSFGAGNTNSAGYVTGFVQ